MTCSGFSRAWIGVELLEVIRNSNVTVTVNPITITAAAAANAVGFVWSARTQLKMHHTVELPLKKEKN